MLPEGGSPETFLTAWGCLEVTESRVPGARVLVRPGASALGLAIAQIVRHAGGEAIGVTRSSGKRGALLEGGFTRVVVARGDVHPEVRERWPLGATAVVDTIASAQSVRDDLALLADRGTVCLAGSLAEGYGTADTTGVDAAFERDEVTFYSSETLTADRHTAVLQQVVDRVAAGEYRTGIDAVIPFELVPEAHRRMEANGFSGKVVVDLS